MKIRVKQVMLILTLLMLPTWSYAEHNLVDETANRKLPAPIIVAEWYNDALNTVTKTIKEQIDKQDDQQRPQQEPQRNQEPVSSQPYYDPNRLSRSETREIQSLLNERGFNAGPSDGLVGSKTVSAIQDYQRQAGLTINGKPSRELLSHLRANRILAKQENSGSTYMTQPNNPSDDSSSSHCTPKWTKSKLGGNLKAFNLEATTSNQKIPIFVSYDSAFADYIFIDDKVLREIQGSVLKLPNGDSRSHLNADDWNLSGHKVTGNISIGGCPLQAGTVIYVATGAYPSVGQQFLLSYFPTLAVEDTEPSSGTASTQKTQNNQSRSLSVSNEIDGDFGLTLGTPFDKNAVSRVLRVEGKSSPSYYVIPKTVSPYFSSYSVKTRDGLISSISASTDKIEIHGLFPITRKAGINSKDAPERCMTLKNLLSERHGPLEIEVDGYSKTSKGNNLRLECEHKRVSIRYYSTLRQKNSNMLVEVESAGFQAAVKSKQDKARAELERLINRELILARQELDKYRALNPGDIIFLEINGINLSPAIIVDVHFNSAKHNFLAIVQDATSYTVNYVSDPELESRANKLRQRVYSDMDKYSESKMSAYQKAERDIDKDMNRSSFMKNAAPSSKVEYKKSMLSKKQDKILEELDKYYAKYLASNSKRTRNISELSNRLFHSSRGATKIKEIVQKSSSNYSALLEKSNLRKFRVSSFDEIINVEKGDLIIGHSHDGLVYKIIENLTNDEPGKLVAIQHKNNYNVFNVSKKRQQTNPKIFKVIKKGDPEYDDMIWKHNLLDDDLDPRIRQHVTF